MKKTEHGPRTHTGAKHVGLARALSKLGSARGRKRFGLVRDGKVCLNGSIVRNPEAPVRLGKDRIVWMARRLPPPKKSIWFSTSRTASSPLPPMKRDATPVYSLLPSNLQWIAPVGRLDRASEGLLLFTNDSEWAARITDPASHLDKTYHVQIGAVADAQLLDALERGIGNSQGRRTESQACLDPSHRREKFLAGDCSG